MAGPQPSCLSSIENTQRQFSLDLVFLSPSPMHGKPRHTSLLPKLTCIVKYMAKQRHAGNIIIVEVVVKIEIKHLVEFHVENLKFFINPGKLIKQRQLVEGHCQKFQSR